MRRKRRIHPALDVVLSLAIVLGCGVLYVRAAALRLFHATTRDSH